MAAKTIRFRRKQFHGKYADVVPKWHLAAHRYSKGEYYMSVVALCGYATTGMLGEVMFSIAKTAPKGEHCQSCIRAAEHISEEKNR